MILSRLIGVSKCPPLRHPLIRQQQPQTFLQFLSFKTFRYSSHQSSPNTSESTVKSELHDLDILRKKLSSTRSLVSKRSQLQSHPECLPLLQLIYSPDVQFNVSSKNVKEFIKKQETSLHLTGSPKATRSSKSKSRAKVKTYPNAVTLNQLSTDSNTSVDLSLSNSLNPNSPYLTISALLHALSTRQITGHNALSSIISFIHHHRLSRSETDLLYKILDKNLKVGCNVSLINSAFSESIPTFPGVALGISASNDDAGSVFGSGSCGQAVDRNIEWFASRKLDGVRCLAFLSVPDVLKPDNTPQYSSLELVSRSGKPFFNIHDIKNSLSRLIRRIHPYMEVLAGPDKKIVLDGELCCLVKQQDKLKEEFNKTMSIVRLQVPTEGGSKLSKSVETGTENRDESKESDELTLRYFIFDVLSLHEFQSKTSTRTLSERLEMFSEVLKKSGIVTNDYSWRGHLVSSREYPSADIERKLLDGFSVPVNLNAQDNNDDNIRMLIQMPVKNEEILNRVVALSRDLEWEGFMLRKDASYEGKRSKSILKFKDWKSDEFTIQDTEIKIMEFTPSTFPIQPIPSDLVSVSEPDGIISIPVLSSIIIHYKSFPVNVGSGLTWSQRITYGRKPELLKGKLVTVEYFEESKSLKARGKRKKRGERKEMSGEGDQGDVSLRFPKVKWIYGDEGREM